MGKVSEQYPRRGFFSAKDVIDGPITLDIAGVAEGREIGDQIKNVVLFENDQRELVLNQPNAWAVADLYGDDMQMWTGKRITLFYDSQVEFKGQKGGVRVRAPDANASNGAKKTTAQTVKPNPPAPPQELNDEIPF